MRNAVDRTRVKTCVDVSEPSRREKESVREMTFALKIILSTVDHLLQNQQIELAGKTPKRLKSRKVFS